MNETKLQTMHEESTNAHEEYTDLHEELQTCIKNLQTIHEESTDMHDKSKDLHKENGEFVQISTLFKVKLKVWSSNLSLLSKLHSLIYRISKVPSHCILIKSSFCGNIEQ